METGWCPPTHPSSPASSNWGCTQAGPQGVRRDGGAAATSARQKHLTRGVPERSTAGKYLPAPESMGPRTPIVLRRGVRAPDNAAWYLQQVGAQSKRKAWCCPAKGSKPCWSYKWGSHPRIFPPVHGKGQGSGGCGKWGQPDLRFAPEEVL